MRRLLVGGSLILVLAGCNALKDAFSGRVDTVARAEGERLGVEQLADWAGNGKQVPLQQEALYRLSKVWVDYSLFAQAMAEGRTLDDSATVTAAMWPFFSQLKWDKLHSKLIGGRPELTAKQVDSAYAAGTHRLFQHILIMLPPNAPPDVQAEKRRAIDGLRRQIVARRGKNFTDLAVQHSEDPGSKEQGGFLTIAEQGDPLVQEFKDASWVLQPGEISPVVRTAYGFHVIRRPSLGDARDVYRFGLQERIGGRADSVLVDSLVKPGDMKLASGALAVARQAVQDLDAQRGSGRALVHYPGGTFRVGDFVRWMYSLEPRVAAAVKDVPEEQLERFLRLIAQRHVLIRLADSAGVQPTAEEWQYAKAQHDSAVHLLRNILRLTPEVMRDSAASAADRERLATAHVDEYLQRVVTGRAQFLPMPPFLSFILRDRADWSIDQAGVRVALEKARAVRGTRDSTAAPPASESPMTPATGPAPVPGKSQ
jgi:hypothetical protein